MKNRTHTRQRARKGVLLIVVLSLLVLFALIGFTFIMVAGQYSRAASANRRVGLYDDQGEELVEQAFYDLLRGTNNPNSALYHPLGDDDSDGAVDEDGGSVGTVGVDDDGDGLIDEDPPGRNICSSLLDDLIGDDTLTTGTVAALLPEGPNDSFAGILATGSFKTYINAYAGQTMTMRTGPVAGLSVRVLYSLANGPSTIFFVESFKHHSVSVNASPGNTFSISGRPYNGQPGKDADESYDAPNRLNPHLAFIPTNAPTTPIIPSFFDRIADIDGDGIPGDYDDVVIDNDRDGILDSGWIDFGFAVKTAADGRRYKPFGAVLCIDLDGRLNLNAHGNLAQLTTVNPSYAGTHPGPLASGATPVGPRGMGFGPADINLSGLFSGNETKLGALFDVRYGADLEPGPAGAAVSNLWLLAGYGIPNDYTASPAGYGARPDVFGGGLLGVDAAGRPAMFNAGLTNEVNVSPYQINLVEPDGADRPIKASEFERLARWTDKDRDALPRLWERHNDLTEADFDNVALRRSVTTSSSFIPVSSAPGSVIEMLVERLKANGLADTPPGFALRTNSRQLTAFETLKGGKMNINRHWGNSLDTTTSPNGVIDELGEASPTDTIFGNVTPYGGAIAADYLNRVPGATDQSMARYNYATQLYCLMMLVTDSGYKIPASPESLTDPQRRELAIRRIAQWAINCVDFRDPDAIMTPFEYDVNPFNGWDVDGDLATDDQGDPVDGTPHPDRRVVWGMEYPDLMFTESLSTHDRGVRDTAFDNFLDLTDEDADVDTAMPLYGSKRIHTGYGGNNALKGDKDLDQTRIPEGSTFLEFYCPRNLATNNPVLPRELYVNDAGTLKLKLDKIVGNSPVWRVAISKPHHSAGDGAPRNALSPLVRRNTNPDTINFDPAELSVSGDNPIERYLWFNSAPPTAATSGETIANTFYVEDAQAALLAPGRYCVVGPRDETYIGAKPISDDATATAETSKGDQLIDLNAGALNMDYKDLTGASAYPLSPAVAANINPPLALNAVIDSPTYPHKRGLNISEPLPTATNKYPVPTHDSDGDGITDAYGDSSVDPPTAASLYPDTPFDSEATPDRPLHAGAILKQQTVENYRTAYLQRLANPLVAWNPAPPDANYVAGQPVNPYITVDWIPLDLNVFNGEDREADDWDTRPGAVGDFDTDDDGTGTLTFAARQRRNPGAPTATNTFWTPGGQLGTGLAEDTAASVTECFRYPLGAANDPMTTLGYVNLPYTPLGGSTVGDPDSPLPWLMWPNRPFVSHYELMLVPASSQSRVLSEFTRANTTASPYLNTNPIGMFGHLLNFYHQSTTAGDSAHFYRLLEYVEVPSRFAGTDRWYSHAYTNTSPLHVNLGVPYKSPFHNISRWRDPGRVNINTIPGADVWEAIDNNGNSGTAFTSFAKIDASRRYRPGAALPQDAYGRFSNPFTGPIVASNATTITGSSVETTLLRPDLDISPLPSGPPLATNLPLLGAPVGGSTYQDPAHHAYFRLQGLQRLGNIVSVQSNVYAIWITIGYFEVDAAGLPIRELGSDTGEIRRHRGFFMVDRSIPVLFERGRNHNVDKTILLRRIIE